MADQTPNGSVNVNAKLLDALGSLTQEIRQLNAHQQNAEGAAKRRTAEVQNALLLEKRSQQAPSPSQFGLSGQAADNAQAALARLDKLNQQRNAAKAQPDRSTPPGVNPVEPEDLNNPSSGEALMFAMMGERGGPFGALRQRQYMLQRNLGWAQGALGGANDFVNGPDAGTIGSIAGKVPGLSQILDWASPTRDPETKELSGGMLSRFMDPQTGKLTGWGTAASMGLAGADKAINVASGWQQMGRSLGYGSAGAQAGLFGFRFPWLSGGASARREGESLAREQQALMGRDPFSGGFGTGLTRDQARAAVGTLAAQGFANSPQAWGGGTNGVSGDNYTIARNLLQPLMNQGLSAQDAAQWTPALRNASTSIQQLKDSLGALSDAAKATKQTVADLNAEVVQAGTIAEGQGGLRGAGAETAMAFTATTGLNPTVSNSLMQNPMYQAMMMGRYGVLPSGITDLPGGAQVGGMMSLVNLMQHAFSGLNKNKYENIPGVGKVLEAKGSDLENSQIASYLGVPKSYLDRLLKEGNNPATQANIMGQLGSATNRTGLFTAGLSKHQQDVGFRNLVDKNASALGLSGSDVHRLDALKGTKGSSQLDQRYQALEKLMMSHQGGSTQNKILGTIQITTAGDAKKHFKATPSSIQIAADSGQGPPTNEIMNSPFGDAMTANMPMSGSFDSIGTPSGGISSTW